jgi:PAS domain S-box-containing protein
MVVTLDPGMRPTAINDYGRQRFQFSQESFPALRAGDFFDKQFRREVAAELKEGDHVSGRETTMTLKSGEKIDISLSLSRMRDARGKPKGYLAVISDISKRRKAELDLKNQILFSRQIFQSIPEMILIVDRRLRVTFINKRARDLIPASSAGIIGQNINSILARNSLESGFDELVRSVLEGGGSVHRINTLNPVLEEENYVDLIVEPLKSGNLIIGGIIMLRDISEWRGLTAQLRSLQGFMQKLINASPYAVISINEHGLITTWNSAAEKILGVSFSGAFGKNLHELLPLFEKYRDAINEVMILKKTVYLNDEQVFIGDEDFKVANFTFYPVTAEQSGVVIHMEDVSALKKLESSLIHAQKMESLGLLTSHIIHDFNNLLSGIMGYASLLEKKIADNPKVQKYVSTIITSSERASTLINQLLNFSRKKMAEKEILNINDLIKEALDFLAMNLKAINLDIQLYQSQILLQADKTKISQILINLIVNARDALESVDRPILRLRTDRVEISEQSDLLDGQYALIEISDNGGGISPENQKKIFEPYSTTKGQGRGTGLGLAIVREIIQDYNGRIELDSQGGRGTQFTILLPVFEQTLYQPPPREEPEAATPLEGLVLLIDDEEVVREIGSDMLKTLGLTCLTAISGSEGIELFKKHAGDISLVILDIEMPGISGEKVFHILRELRPDVKILIASGYGRDYLESEVFKSKIGHFMPKPFKTEQLAYQVNRLLRGGDA